MFSKDDWRETLADEGVPSGPEMARIASAFFSASDTEGLAGTATGPNGKLRWPGGECEGIVPQADAGEGVEALPASNVGRVELADVSLNNSAAGDVSVRDESPEPGASVPVDLVVDGLSVK